MSGAPLPVAAAASELMRIEPNEHLTKFGKIDKICVNSEKIHGKL